MIHKDIGDQDACREIFILTEGRPVLKSEEADIYFGLSVTDERRVDHQLTE